MDDLSRNPHIYTHIHIIVRVIGRASVDYLGPKKNTHGGSMNLYEHYETVVLFKQYFRRMEYIMK